MQFVENVKIDITFKVTLRKAKMILKHQPM